MMTSVVLKQLMPLAQAIDVSDHLIIERVVSDSRQVQPGDLFIALSGEKFDAHDFLKDVFTQGAAVCLVHDAKRVPPGMPAMVVNNSLEGLQALAKSWRQQQSRLEHLVAVTGSNGKTTVKGMIASIFLAAKDQDRVLATTGNLNNEIGVPLTLLGLRDTHELAVIELGMNHPDETRLLASMASADIALINNAQREHQEFMTNVEMVAKEHALAIEALPARGVAVFPADSEYSSYWREVAGGRRVVTFAWGVDAGADVVGRWVSTQNHVIAIDTALGAIEVQLNILGEHNAKNALAATAVAIAAGIDLGDIKAGLEAFNPVNGRMQSHQVGNTTVIDDSYNANPDSVKAAVDVLAGMKLPAWLVLGDMGEVGEKGPEFHREVGAYAAEKGIEKLFATGELTKEAVRAYDNYPNRSGKHFDDVATLCVDLQNALQAVGQQSTAVLVKGSRFMKMERVVKTLIEEMH